MKKVKNYLLKEIPSWDDTKKVSNLLEIIITCLNSLPDLETIELKQTQSVINQLESMVKYYNQIIIELLHNDEAEVNNSINKIIKSKGDLIASISELKKKLAFESYELEEIEKLETTLTSLYYLLNDLAIDISTFESLQNQMEHFKKLGEGYLNIEQDLSECQVLIDKLELKLKKLTNDKQIIETKLREVINEI